MLGSPKPPVLFWLRDEARWVEIRGTKGQEWGGVSEDGAVNPSPPEALFAPKAGSGAEPRSLKGFLAF